MKSHRKYTLGAAFFAFAIIAIVAVFQFKFAMHKPFWGDEGYDMINTCPAGYSQMLFEGVPGQCSRPPLFYVLHKLVVDRVQHFDENILYQYRLISLGSAALCLAVVFWGLAGPLGFAWALLAVGMLLNQPIFHYFSAEARPYMLWILCFAATILAGGRLGSKKLGEVRPNEKWTYGIAAFALMLVVSPGMMQLFCVGACLLLTWRLYSKKTPLVRNFLFPLTGVLCLIGLFYAFASCELHDMGMYDLLRTKDWHLVLAVANLLVPQGSIITWGFNALVLVGMALPFVLWRRRSRWNAHEKYLFATSLILGVQLLLTVFIGVLVAFKHHFFIQRVFIYLIVCRAVYVALGGSYLASRLERRIPYLRKASTALAVVMLTFYVARVPSITRDLLAGKGEVFEKAAASCPTERPSGSYIVYFHPEKHANEFAPNFLAELGYQLDACGWKPATKTRALLALEGTKSEPLRYLVSDQPPQNAKRMSQCGRDFVLSP